MFTQFLILLSADEIGQKKSASPLSSPRVLYQSVLLYSVFEDIDEGFMANIELSIPAKDIQFTGKKKACRLGFLNGFLQTFSVVWFFVGNFHIDYMPQSVEDLEITNCLQTFRIFTRRLPRKAQQVNLRDNEIHGSIDLSNLPPNLIVLDVQNNQLKDKIFIGNLPSSMEKLLLRANPFRQTSVYYAELPKSLKKIDLMNTKIRRARPISHSLRVRDKTIFAIR